MNYLISNFIDSILKYILKNLTSSVNSYRQSSHELNLEIRRLFEKGKYFNFLLVL